MICLVFSCVCFFHEMINSMKTFILHELAIHLPDFVSHRLTSLSHKNTIEMSKLYNDYWSYAMTITTPAGIMRYARC